ncbi:hypothetical protein [Paraflavitalea sp. CAU 1676]|uniref:hypothetical protein n=1 Tax=Paraflavitalea sp. CAU 1676 TaxID=3032598 RepID=UPI0023D9B1C9|nr:hypothetical protein [Paraflavitalea sp. CAU 1676]MDF2193102.1 hypothetical protein [Paraflavitalea sp. CAU 1676]
MKKSITLLIFLSVAHLNSIGQIRWIGTAGDKQWNTAANWQGNMVPTPGDDVLLDNSLFAGNYSINLPIGNITVHIRSLTIQPSAAHTIELVLPFGNTALPALQLSNTATCLAIHAGGIFRNNSGASSGISIQVAGVMWIGNGGRYIHNTPIAHVNLVAALSTVPGTELGIFEFDIKGGSPLLSVSGRTYGTLAFSAVANGSSKTYNINGLNRATIRGDLIIGNQVNLNLALDDTIFIAGNLVQQGGMLNLGSAPYNTVIRIAKALEQTSGIITEKDNGFPVLEFCGSSVQNISVAAGGIANDITLKINNPAGATLQTPVSLPYKLQLQNGRLVTTPSKLLTLQPACTVHADSLTTGTFIDGPLKKEGLSATGQFMFPVGKGNAQRWLSLVNVTGTFTVEFHRSNPASKSSVIPASIHHISRIEHWSILADALSSPQAQVKLSFNDPNSGGVTDMMALRVAQLSPTGWVDMGNWERQGTPGSNGFVMSEPVATFAPGQQYFTLASTSATLNPLLLGPRGQLHHAEGSRLSATLRPSVTSGFTQLIITSPRRMTIHCKLVNAAGRVCEMRSIQLQQGHTSIAIDVSKYPRGIYTMSITTLLARIEPIRLVRL